MSDAGVHAFAFQTGHWIVYHRKLRERLAGCQDWHDFTGTCKAWELLEGAGNVDDHWIGGPEQPYAAATVRRLEPNGTWSIWWVDSRSPGVHPPMSGTFVDGVGAFFGKDEWRGRPIDVRFIWSQLNENPRWEQAFSEDGGTTWEANWIMEFRRFDEETGKCIGKSTNQAE